MGCIDILLHPSHHSHYILYINHLHIISFILFNPSSSLISCALRWGGWKLPSCPYHTADSDGQTLTHRLMIVAMHEQSAKVHENWIWYDIWFRFGSFKEFNFAAYGDGPPLSGHFSWRSLRKDSVPWPMLPCCPYFWSVSCDWLWHIPYYWTKRKLSCAFLQNLRKSVWRGCSQLRPYAQRCWQHC